MEFDRSIKRIHSISDNNNNNNNNRELTETTPLLFEAREGDDEVKSMAGDVNHLEEISQFDHEEIEREHILSLSTRQSASNNHKANAAAAASQKYMANIQNQVSVPGNNNISPRSPPSYISPTTSNTGTHSYIWDYLRYSDDEAYDETLLRQLKSLPSPSVSVDGSMKEVLQETLSMIYSAIWDATLDE